MIKSRQQETICYTASIAARFGIAYSYALRQIAKYHWDTRSLTKTAKRNNINFTSKIRQSSPM